MRDLGQGNLFLVTLEPSDQSGDGSCGTFKDWFMVSATDGAFETIPALLFQSETGRPLRLFTTLNSAR
jgi:hypothetical protein